MMDVSKRRPKSCVGCLFYREIRHRNEVEFESLYAKESQAGKSNVCAYLRMDSMKRERGSPEEPDSTIASHTQRKAKKGGEARRSGGGISTAVMVVERSQRIFWFVAAPVHFFPFMYTK